MTAVYSYVFLLTINYVDKLPPQWKEVTAEAMPKSLLEQLPEIVATGRKTAERILESIESRQRITLQTREVVLPAKDSAVQDWITSQTRVAQREVFTPGQTSLLENPQPLLGADSNPVRPEPVEGLP